MSSNNESDQVSADTGKDLSVLFSDQISFSDEEELLKDEEDCVGEVDIEMTDDERERLKQGEQEKLAEVSTSSTPTDPVNSAETIPLVGKTKSARRRIQKRAKRRMMKETLSVTPESETVDKVDVEVAKPTIPTLIGESKSKTGVNPNLDKAKKPIKGKTFPKPPSAFSNGEGSKEINSQGNKNMKRKLNSPGESTPVSKKQNQQLEYAEAAKLDLTVLIRRMGSKLDVSNYLKLRGTLIEKVDEVSIEVGKPRFESTTHKNGACVMVCSDSKSRDWLLELVTKLQEDQPELKWWASTADRERLRMRIVLQVKDSNSAQVETILKRLRDSNPGLQTDEWVFIKNLNVSPHGRMMLFQVDRESAVFINNSERKLYYLLQRINVDINGVRQLLSGSGP